MIDKKDKLTRGEFKLFKGMIIFLILLCLGLLGIRIYYQFHWLWCFAPIWIPASVSFAFFVWHFYKVNK